jgi:CheY-like chemotaxis protein
MPLLPAAGISQTPLTFSRCRADEITRGVRMTVANSKVLLVEDSKFLRMATERSLSNAGYLVSTAADGEEALQVANDKLPDLILLDMMLPKISGPNVLKALKENPATMHIPVVVLTSLSQKNEGKLLSEGAAAYFEKSALALDQNSSRLADMVETVLASAGRQKKALI